MKRILLCLQGALFVMAVAISVISCEKVFPNDRLDHYWRLNEIKYKLGVDLFGQPCRVDTIGNAYFGFAQDLVQIEDHKRHRSYFGVLTDMGDSLRFDFTMYKASDGFNPMDIENTLKRLGVDGLKTTLHIDFLGRKSMILSCDKTELFFEKW